ALVELSQGAREVGLAEDRDDEDVDLDIPRLIADDAKLHWTHSSGPNRRADRPARVWDPSLARGPQRVVDATVRVLDRDDRLGQAAARHLGHDHEDRPAVGRQV